MSVILFRLVMQININKYRARESNHRRACLHCAGKQYESVKLSLSLMFSIFSVSSFDVKPVCSDKGLKGQCHCLHSYTYFTKLGTWPKLYANDAFTFGPFSC